MGGADVCRLLDWDSQFFGRRIARVAAHRLDQDLADVVVAWAKRHAVDCLYFLADADDAETLRLAQHHGFHQVDVRVTFERPIDAAPLPATAVMDLVVRSATAADRPVLGALARISHRDTRFYYDPRFPRSQCDALYETWIDKSLAGSADAVLVIDHAGTAQGYLSCHIDDSQTGSIGLFAVGTALQGRGAGRALLSEALRWFAEHGRRRVSVVTQERNARARRLYEAAGFKRQTAQVWYHRWCE